MKHLVSVITPTYNHEAYIDTCIKSVLNQNYENWEMIIIDDNSADNTYNIALNFAKTDKRIKVLRHKSRWGIKKLKDTYNQALALSKGDLIAILEGDDYWPKDKLGIQIKAFSNNKVIFSFGDCVLVDKQNYPLDVQYYLQNRNNLNNSPIGSILNLFQDVDFYIAPVTIMIRKTAILKINGFKNDNVYPFADIPTFLNLSLEGNFLYLNKILGYYRKHENSVWFNYAKETQAMGRTEIVHYLKFFATKNKNNLKKKNINLLDKISSEKQKKIINNKKKEKDLSIMKHEIAFGDYKHAKITSKKTLKKKQTLATKIFVLLIFSGLMENKNILKTLGRVKILSYKLLHRRL